MAKSNRFRLRKKIANFLDRILPEALRRFWAEVLLWLLSPKQKRLASHFVGRNLMKDRKFLEYLKCRLESLDLEKELFGEAEPAPDRNKLLSSAIEQAARLGTEGLWLEFGVWRGASVNHIAREAPSRTVYGFDSFEGLPEDWVVGSSIISRRGKRDEKGQFPAVEKNVRLIKGWFNETVPAFLKEHPEPAVFVHIDSDLYSSAKYVLEQLRFADGAVIVFDEYYNYPAWKQGEHKAFREFLSARPDAATACLGFCSTGQAAFIVRHKESSRYADARV